VTCAKVEAETDDEVGVRSTEGPAEVTGTDSVRATTGPRGGGGPILCMHTQEMAPARSGETGSMHNKEKAREVPLQMRK